MSDFIKRCGGLLVVAATIGLAAISHVSATPLFDDTFVSFALGSNWNVPAFPDVSGAPNVNLSAAGGFLRMTSAQGNFQNSGIATIDSFSFAQGSVELDFRTGPASDSTLPLPPGTVDQNIDGLIVLELINPITGNYFAAGLFGGFFGTDRYFFVGSPAGPPVQSSSPFGPGGNDWQYGQDYRVLFESTVGGTNVEFESGSGTPLFSYEIAETFDYLGSFNVALLQQMGTPGQLYYNDAFVDDVAVDATAVPEPTSATLFLSGLIALVMLRGHIALGASFRRYGRNAPQRRKSGLPPPRLR